MNNRSAISLLRRPEATMRTISSSRAVTTLATSREAASRRNSVSRARLTERFSNHCSPACTLRTHCTRKRGAISLSTTPGAPRRMASTTSSSSSAAVRTTTRVGSFSSRIWRSTSRPSFAGMRRSSTTTSGRCLRTAARAASPSRQRATTLMSCSAENSCSNPSRTRGWSSASTSLMAMAYSGPGERQVDVEARPRIGRVNSQGSSQGGNPPLQRDRPEFHLGQPRVVIAAAKGKPTAVIGHYDAHMLVLGLKGDADSGGLRMPGGVEEGFADNEVDLLRQVAGKLHVRFAHAQFDAQVPFALNPLSQLLQTDSQPALRLGRDKPQGLHFPDEQAQTALLTGDQRLEVPQTFLGRQRILVQQALHRL